MAPPSPTTQKRKRGRPSNASKQEEQQDAPQSRDNDDDDNMGDEAATDADEGQPRRRGKPKKAVESSGQGEVDAVEEPAPWPRKRGRPSLEEKSKTVDEGGEKVKRKRGRPSLDKKAAEEEDAGPAGSASRKTKKKTATRQRAEEDQQPQEESQTAPRKRRGRKAAQRQPEAEEQEEAEDEEKEPETTEPAPRRKRGRPSLQNRPPEDDSAREQQRTKRRKAGRPSLQDVRPSEAQNKGAGPEDGGAKEGKRRGRQEGGAGTKGKRKGVPQPPGPESGGDKNKTKTASRREQEEETDPQPRGVDRRRRSKQQAEREGDEQPTQPASPPKPYAHVVPSVRRVRQSVIQAKWSPLSGPSLSATSSILHLAHRPILQRLSNTHQRRAHTSAALRLTTHRISKKIARGLPFPPAAMAAPARGGNNPPRQTDAGRETELDFESVLDGKVALEKVLGPGLHAVEVLRAEKERVERELEGDYEALKALEVGARANAREQRGLLKKAHVLAPEASSANKDEGEEKDLVVRHDGPAASGNLFSNIPDKDLSSLALQLSGHVESMRTNLQQTEGIVPQLARSRAALRDVLLRHLSQSAYEQVVLG